MRWLASTPSVCLLVALPCLGKDIEVPRDEQPIAVWEKARADAGKAQWEDAAAGYQALLLRSEPVGGVVPTGEAFARGWKEAAREALLSLPADGRTAYQKLFGPQAVKALSEARTSGKREDLWKVERQFPASDEAWEARKLLSGDDAPPEEGIRALETLLDHDPSAGARRTETALRIARFAAKIGEVGRIRLLAKRARKEWAEAKVLVDGKETPLLDALSAAVGDAKAQPCKEWPRWGGSASGSGVFPEVRQVGRYLWSLDVDEGAAPASRGQAVEVLTVGGPGPASDPVVSGGRLYLIAGDTLVASDLEKGTSLWTYRVPQATPPQQILIQRNDAGARQHPTPPCVDGDLVAFEYGRERGSTSEVRRGRAQPRLSEIHVLDAKDGRVLWTWNTDMSWDTEKEPVFKGKTSLSSPLLTSEGLFTLAITTDASRNATLLAFDRETGKPKWKRNLATIPLNPAPWSMFAHDPDAILASHGGTVVAATNLGVVGAVEAATGDLLWTYTYGEAPAGGAAQDQNPNNPLESRRASPPPSWVILADGVAMFGAADTSSAWAISTRTGASLWWNRLYAGDAAAGYGAGRLYIAGGRAQVFDVDTGKLKWNMPAKANRVAPATNGCLVWEDWTLTQRELDHGDEAERYEWKADTQKDGHVMEGAILPLGDRLLVQEHPKDASALGKIYCFRLQDPVGEAEGIERKIDEWISRLASPKYAERQAAAEALLQAGDAVEARLKEAAESRDREVAWRASEILEVRKKSHYLERVPKKQK